LREKVSAKPTDEGLKNRNAATASGLFTALVV